MKDKWWNRELTLKYPSKGNQGTTRGKEKILFDLGGHSNGRQSNGRSNPEVVGSIPTEVKKNFFFTSCGSLIPFTKANAQWVFHGFHVAL